MWKSFIECVLEWKIGKDFDWLIASEQELLQELQLSDVFQTRLVIFKQH
jgi:hypothetical protein